MVEPISIAYAIGSIVTTVFSLLAYRGVQVNSERINQVENQITSQDPHVIELDENHKHLFGYY
jgi:hypothetical protein